MRSYSDLEESERRWRKRRLFGPRRRGSGGLFLWGFVVVTTGVGAFLLYQELSPLI